MSVSRHICRICGAAGNSPTFLAREMMFGTREAFEYFQCHSCSCLQIADIPDDLGRFYPDSYYSLNVKNRRRTSVLKTILLKQRFRNALFNRGYKLNKMLSKVIKMPGLLLDEVLPLPTVLQRAGIKNFAARFLDIGCGASPDWLSLLRTVGFRNLVGVDPFITSDVIRDGITVLKRRVAETTGIFDLITFHHSLEHIPDQKEALVSACRLLAPNGVLLVRIPIVSSYAWRYYGTNWVEMDPPRHLYLHSRESIQLLARNAGLSLYASICDSKAFEFYGSEQYLREIPLTAENSYWLKEDNQIFTRAEIEDFHNLARQVNERDDCGRACFLFRASK